jgi:hypothetical protein
MSDSALGWVLATPDNPMPSVLGRISQQLTRALPGFSRLPDRSAPYWASVEFRQGIWAGWSVGIRTGTVHELTVQPASRWDETMPNVLRLLQGVLLPAMVLLFIFDSALVFLPVLSCLFVKAVIWLESWLQIFHPSIDEIEEERDRIKEAIGRVADVEWAAESSPFGEAQKTPYTSRLAIFPTRLLLVVFVAVAVAQVAQVGPLFFAQTWVLFVMTLFLPLLWHFRAWDSALDLRQGDFYFGPKDHIKIPAASVCFVHGHRRGVTIVTAEEKRTFASGSRRCFEAILQACPQAAGVRFSGEVQIPVELDRVRPVIVNYFRHRLIGFSVAAAILMAISVQPLIWILWQGGTELSQEQAMSLAFSVGLAATALVLAWRALHAWRLWRRVLGDVPA